ncbi:YigZ family protein [candidate division KSB3 bacterium]|uniref:YigZ family protein n=1 Tax=candidate division KSB3 bacterium TaxID=2044937 RepID=A0A2G6E369_9BACT|nr:MAG: YigZ family protein [candidate division KSB3 bacterium]PIE29085.1 MAG: YigZ family protein [candidate division KSB3 bacterium]
MAQRYPIPAQTTRTELIVKRSRFIATVAAAETVEAARAFIRKIRDEMPDATHHVYAFRIGYGSSINEGLSDDGEPSGTSGKPTMAVLRGADLGDVVLVITRYFGGTKLGTGGLVRAYSDSAKAVLEQLPLREKLSVSTIVFALPYSNYEQVKRMLPAYQARILQENFSDRITLTLSIPDDLLQSFSGMISDFTVGNASPDFADLESQAGSN